MKVVSVLLAFLFPTIVSGLLEDYIFSEDGLTAVNQDLAGVSNEIATLSALTPVIGRLRTAKCKYQITYNLYIKSSDIVGEQTAYKNRIPDTANTLNGQDVNRFGGYVIAGVPVYQGASPGSQVGTLSETIFLVNPFAFPTSPPVLKCVTDGSVSFAGVSGTADRVSFQGMLQRLR
jgi:hypothetical protein